MQRTIALLVGVCLLGLPACQQEDAQPCGPEGPQPGVTCLGSLASSHGEARTYRVHAPVGYEAGTPVPLVVSFSGLGESAELHEWGSLQSERADVEGFVVVYPDQIDGGWRAREDSVADVDFVMELIDALEAELSIDANRIYANGLSAGGVLAHDLGCLHAERFAGIGLVAPPIKRGTPACEPSMPLPVMLMFGGRDNVVIWPEGAPYQLAPGDVTNLWADLNGAALTDTTSGEVMDTWSYSRPLVPNADVEMIYAPQMPHHWPNSRDGERGSGFDGIDVLWPFFEAHRRW